MYANFQSAYYEKNPEPLLNKVDFIKYLPLIVIDSSKQYEYLKNAPVDVRLEFESRNNFPAGTSAYSLILLDSGDEEACVRKKNEVHRRYAGLQTVR